MTVANIVHTVMHLYKFLVIIEQYIDDAAGTYNSFWDAIRTCAAQLSVHEIIDSTTYFDYLLIVTELMHKINSSKSN